MAMYQQTAIWAEQLRELVELGEMFRSRQDQTGFRSYDVVKPDMQVVLAIARHVTNQNADDVCWPSGGEEPQSLVMISNSYEKNDKLLSLADWRSITRLPSARCLIDRPVDADKGSKVRTRPAAPLRSPTYCPMPALPWPP
jgi:hypothetical protein